MSLVELPSGRPYLNLRVYRRSGKVLILFWNRLLHIEGKIPSIRAKSIEDGQTVEITDYILDPPPAQVDAEKEPTDLLKTIPCLIRETKNGLDERKNYYVTVDYNDGVTSQGIKVHRAGVYPDHDKEDREKNFHSFLWDEKSSTWRKMNGIMVEGKFCAAMTIVPCPKCGWSGGS